MSIRPRSADVHAQCWELLPWLVNERLSRSDAARVEAHLHDCALCQTELREQQALRQALRSVEPVVIAPQASLQKLLDRIDAADAPDIGTRSVASASPPALGRRMPWLAIAAAFQGVVIAALCVTLWQKTHEELTAPRFTTLSSPARSAVATGPVMRVVFDGGMTQQQLNALLLSVGAQIVAGPSEAGVYTLALTETTADTDAVQAAVQQLRANPAVRFAELAHVAP